MADAPLRRRTAFFLSDGTAITAETLGRSLIAQFETVRFSQQSLRFVNTPERALEAQRKINETAVVDGERPVVFSTLVMPDLRSVVMQSNALYLDIFATFIDPLEQELESRSSLSLGRFHGLTDTVAYSSRIDAVDFTVSHDDGSTTKHLEQADIIIIGISRTGKTPTCLYLSLQYGIRAANFPITEDDLEHPRLPNSLVPFRDKLLALSTDARRMQQIRQERYANSRYASFEQCDYEIRQSEALYRRLGIPTLHTTLKSIEEIAATIVDRAGLDTPRRRAGKAHV
jgi:regulator of PEP synthase PpsR (kinase-PPPase family)